MCNLWIHEQQVLKPNDAQSPILKELLISRSGPLENNHNTILVVGGVHWLATHHLGVIKKALEREGLDRIRVVMKTLGAGFHQPVDGLHCLSLVSDTLNVTLVDFYLVYNS